MEGGPEVWAAPFVDVIGGQMKPPFIPMPETDAQFCDQGQREVEQ